MQGCLLKNMKDMKFCRNIPTDEWNVYICYILDICFELTIQLMCSKLTNITLLISSAINIPLLQVINCKFVSNDKFLKPKHEFI